MDGLVYYNQYQFPQMYNFPLMLTEWNPLVPNTFTSPILPVSLISPQIVTPIICPYTSALVTDQVCSIVPAPVIFNNLYSDIYETQSNCPDKAVSLETLSEDIYMHENVPEQVEEENDKIEDEKLMNPIELYLRLPKDYFPTARMLTIDPNLVIEEFCKIESISENVSWILDLEFGIPRVPITRTIATYDVKFNSIHCKNTPGAIHPGFEKCDSDFKRIMLFYYDCIVSNWYNGYIVLNYDKSVENFQSWLQIPMQVFGMCWP